MFARVVELNAKPGKAKEISTSLTEKVLPILRDQDGFTDLILLTSSTEPDKALAISFWESQEDAERYSREGFSRVNTMMSEFVTTQPTVRAFHVTASTTEDISAERAA